MIVEDLSFARHARFVIATDDVEIIRNPATDHGMAHYVARVKLRGGAGLYGYGATPEDARNDLDQLLSPREWAKWLTVLSLVCRAANDAWWRDPKTGEPLESRNKGELIALMHSELSEALEGERKCLMDDHLPDRAMAQVELADTLVRIFDYCGGFGYDLGGAFADKMAYNAQRADHKPENRASGATGEKKF